MRVLAVAIAALAFVAVACEKKSDTPIQVRTYDPKIDGPVVADVRPNPDILQDQAKIAKALAKPAEGSGASRPPASAPATAPAVATPGVDAVKSILTALAASTKYTQDSLALLPADEKARVEKILASLAAAEKLRQTLQTKFQMTDLPTELKEIVALLPAGVTGLADLRKMPVDQLTIRQQDQSVIVTPPQGRKMTFVQADGQWQLSLDDPTKQEIAALLAVAEGLNKVIAKLEAEIANDQLIKDAVAGRAKELVDQEVASARQQLLKGTAGTASSAPAPPAAPTPAAPASPAPAPAAPAPAAPAPVAPAPVDMPPAPPPAAAPVAPAPVDMPPAPAPAAKPPPGVLPPSRTPSSIPTRIPGADI